MTLGADEATGHVPLSNQSHFVDEDVSNVRQRQELIRIGVVMVTGLEDENMGLI